MSDLKNIEKLKLEKLFEMGSGYVCDFSNRTFGDFILDSVSVDVYSDGYDELGDSKANRLRNFWKKESNHLVAKLTEEMLDYWRTQKISDDHNFYSSEKKEYNQPLHDECLKIVKRLKLNKPVENLDNLVVNNHDKNFSVLVDTMRDSINKDRPDLVIDRLHTYVVKYIRSLCDKHTIKYTKETPLHSLFGLYVKELQKNKAVESEMSIRILKSSISLLDAFNDVRNNKSLAHDNDIINYDESILIFNSISNSIKFIESVESKLDADKAKETQSLNLEDIRVEDIPF